MDTSSKHLGYLDGWRGLAISFLLIGHFFPVIKIDMGLVGVNLFFVLSGNLMCGLLFVKKTPLNLFYRRRVARIVPAYLVFIGTVVLCYLAADFPIAWAEVLGALSLVNYHGYTGGKSAMPIGHSWSLSIEEHSYIVLSLVALWIRIRGGTARWMLLALACLMPVLYAAGWRSGSVNQPGLGTWISSEINAFGVFCSGALLLWLHHHPIPRLPAVVYPAMFVGAVFLHWWSIPGPMMMAAGVGLFAVCLNSLAAAPDVVKRVLSWWPLRLMGLWSYSIYLWQQPFYFARAHLGMNAYEMLVVGIGCGVLSYYLVESPSRRWLNARWHTPSNVSHAAPPAAAASNPSV